MDSYSLLSLNSHENNTLFILRNVIKRLNFQISQEQAPMNFNDIKMSSVICYYF